MRPDKKRTLSMDGFYPPVKKTTRGTVKEQGSRTGLNSVVTSSATQKPQTIATEKPQIEKDINTPKKSSNKKKLTRFLSAITALLLFAFITAYAWYEWQLTPVTTDNAKHVRVTILTGSSSTEIADNLKANGVIRSRLAFSVYLKLSGNDNKLKAGSYDLRPSLSTQKIVEHIVSGKDDTFNVTFLPGDTLENGRKMLIGLGYSAAEVDQALQAMYVRPLFASKPSSADLEGYLYGETIRFKVDATIATILNRFFDEYELVIQENKLVDAFKKQGLTLFEGITLASIVQKETSNPDSQRQVARVFLNRMKIGMNLGSDVTYQYAAKKMGVAPDPKLDSPYNTRIHVGLPPGPIATPGKSALLSVASPADNDYLFFLSGDDNLMHYAKTDEEHARNVANYCKIKCLVP